MLYMYAVPKALQQYQGVKFDGRVVYPDHEVDIPSAALDDVFVNNVNGLIKRLASPNPARRVPSHMECGFCDITTNDCPERIEVEDVGMGNTEDF